VRRCARFECAAAENGRAGFFKPISRFLQLFFGFHRTRSRHHHHVFTADFHFFVDGNDGVFVFCFAARELEWL